MTWQIIYWTTTSGKAPAKEFLDQLQETTQSKVRNLYRLILEFGPHLGIPHTKSLTGYKPLIEFRIMGEAALRLIATIDSPYIIILHAFKKKTQKIPLKELETAYKRWQQLILA